VNVIDSSGWLEWFADGPGARHFAPALSDTDRLVVPAISIVEGFRVLLRQRGESAALAGAAVMRQAQVVALDDALAMDGARLSVMLRLPMADSIILATARRFGAVLWTQDEDFASIDGVRYFGKRAADPDRAAPAAGGA